ncbi:hypothetical protein L1987_37220 [Smallanthus sonchifolius]|uniref:Uncharacterized protein n=1 Tax=Smallanthus sonchifolius TaxID=185202 RepID=A0ACB9HFA7_9ASTR|nr:hypothetical protein L1987_37220 [Smallanthus sonchifolius]
MATAAPSRSFLQVAATEETVAPPIRVVQMEGLIREEDEEIEAVGANYQLEMMRCLREVNVDNNTVG